MISRFDTVIVPHMRSKMRVSEKLGMELSTLISSDQPFVIALTVKDKGTKPLTADSFYMFRSLLTIESVQTSDQGHIVYVKSLKRIKHKNLHVNKSVVIF